MKGGIISYHSNTKFALLKNSNLLPHPGREKPHSTTFDNQLIELESVDSTNNYAMARIHEGLACDGMAFITHNQWAGKGQRGKNWFSQPGQNLTMSIVFEPGRLILTQQFLFSAAIALGILKLVKSLKKGNWSIKWPNDIYWNDRKAAGILIENVIIGAKLAIFCCWHWSKPQPGNFSSGNSQCNFAQTILPAKIMNQFHLQGKW